MSYAGRAFVLLIGFASSGLGCAGGGGHGSSLPPPHSTRWAYKLLRKNIDIIFVYSLAGVFGHFGGVCLGLNVHFHFAFYTAVPQGTCQRFALVLELETTLARRLYSEVGRPPSGLPLHQSRRVRFTPKPRPPASASTETN